MLSEEDVKVFRCIPTKTNTFRIFTSYPNSCSGKEICTFLSTSFNTTFEEAEKWGTLLLQGGVIKALNFKLSSKFSGKSNYFYDFCPVDQQNLFWLEEVIENEESEKSECPHAQLYSIDPDNDQDLHDLKKIPEVPALPFIGNALDVAGPLDMNRSMCIMGREICPKYDGIFRLSLMGHTYIVVSHPDIVNQVFESPHFGKRTETDAIFQQLRTFRGEGLTTVADGPLHTQCQGVVAPTLVKGCFHHYVPKIISTMNKCFREEFGQSHKDVDMRAFWKKCTLRVMGKIAISVDLYEGTKWASFVENLTYVADEAINRVFKGTSFIPFFNYSFKKAVKSMKKEILAIVKARREEHEIHGRAEGKRDLLDIMLTTPLRTDENGKEIFMSDEIIRANITTILSAGHSTTTSMLSWCLNFLYDMSLGNSDYRYQLLQEIHSISEGDKKYSPTVQDVYKKMPLLASILKETLRLSPPIPTIVRHCVASTDLCGYLVNKGETVMISCVGTHLNPASWDDPTTFDPHRHNTAPPRPCSFIPWASGPRQCIGREFAMLTGRIGMFLLLNQYSLELSPSSRVMEDEHLFVFPKGLLMNAERRKQLKVRNPPVVAEKTPPEEKKEETPPEEKEKERKGTWDGLKMLIRESGHKVNILCGTKSAQGNTQTVANKLVEKAQEFNFHTGTSPKTLDEFLPSITSPPPRFTIVALCLSTYQGKPSPSASQSFRWLQDLVRKQEENPQDFSLFLENFHFFVFGCGNRNWASTYQKVAIFFNNNLVKLGAKRICEPGLYDESVDDLDEVFSRFYKDLAPKLMHSIPEIGTKRLRAMDAALIANSAGLLKPQIKSSALSLDVLGVYEEDKLPPVIKSSARSNKELFDCPILAMKNITPDAHRSTLHIEFEMQPSMSYRAGDHAVICPTMPKELVDRVLNRFVDFDENSVLRWSPHFLDKSKCQFHLPLLTPMSVGNILRNLLDIKAAPTKQFLANYVTIVDDRNDIERLSAITIDSETCQKWLQENKPLTCADILDSFPPCGDQLGRLMEILPVIKPRNYSICSSPKITPNSFSLCVGVVEEEMNGSTHTGACSFYLKSLMEEEGASVTLFIEEADESFAVPENDDTTMFLVSGGTGFAPMRSFIEERKARKASGAIYVFFGCRDETDLLYKEEMEQYVSDGVVTGWFIGYSRSKNEPKEYVQDKLRQQANLLWKGISSGAHLYVCGNGSRVGVGTRDALLHIIQSVGGSSEEEAQQFLSAMEEGGRYEQDVWG